MVGKFTAKGRIKMGTGMSGHAESLKPPQRRGDLETRGEERQAPGEGRHPGQTGSPARLGSEGPWGLPTDPQRMQAGDKLWPQEGRRWLDKKCLKLLRSDAYAGESGRKREAGKEIKGGGGFVCPVGS